MPRQERTKSGTGIYHVMLRGINKQDIFEDDGIGVDSPRVSSGQKMDHENEVNPESWTQLKGSNET